MATVIAANTWGVAVENEEKVGPARKTNEVGGRNGMECSSDYAIGDPVSKPMPHPVRGRIRAGIYVYIRLLRAFLHADSLTTSTHSPI